MAVIDKSGELRHLIFSPCVEILSVWITDVEIGRSPSDSQDSDSELFEKCDFLPSSFIRPYPIRDIIANVFVFIIEGAVGKGGVFVSVFFGLNEFKNIHAFYFTDVGLFNLIFGSVCVEIGHHLRNLINRHGIKIDAELIVGQVSELVELGESKIIQFID